MSNQRNVQQPRERGGHVRAGFGRSLSPILAAGLLGVLFWAALWSPGPALAQQTRAGFPRVAVTAGTLGPATIPDPTADMTLTGGIFSQYGFAVSAAGDVNGDGIDDLLVGADNAGMAYIYTGTSAGLSETPLAELGPFGGRFGHSVAGGGNVLRDIDGDGVDDFLVGAPFASVGATTEVGMVYVYTGSAALAPTLAVTLTGEAAGDRFGWAIAVAGNLNDDEYADIVVGAFQEIGGNPGKVYVYYGGPDGIVNSPALTLTGENAGDGFGYSVAALGDVNGSGYDDFAVGAWKNTEGGVDAGKVTIYYGGPAGIDPDNKSTLIGDEGTLFGTAVHAAGDVNGDGYADLVVGADAFSATGARGLAYVFLGSSTGMVTTPVFAAVGETDNDRFGFSVGGGGDLNGDGFDDVVIGANQFSSDVLTETGKAYVYAGCIGGVLPDVFFSDQGVGNDDRFGRSATVAGDLNGDGYDDLVIGAFAAKSLIGAAPVPHGQVYVYYGGPADVCAAKIEVTKHIGLADYPPVCGPSAAIPAPTNALTVPVDTPVAYCYTVENTGNLTLTRHTLVDDGDGLGELFAGRELSLAPGMTYTHVVTRVAPATPGVAVAGTVSWTASISITAPGGADTNPPGAVVTTTAQASGRLTASPPGLDQDGDGTPDNAEGAGDANGNGIPAYLDPDEKPDPEPEGPRLHLPVLVR